MHVKSGWWGHDSSLFPSPYFSIPLTLPTMNKLNSVAVGSRDWEDGQSRQKSEAGTFPGRSTHRSPQVNELLPHLGHEGLLGHQGPVQALVELNQLAVHLRHLEHTSTTRWGSEGRPAPHPQHLPHICGPATRRQGTRRLSWLETQHCLLMSCANPPLSRTHLWLGGCEHYGINGPQSMVGTVPYQFFLGLRFLSFIDTSLAKALFLIWVVPARNDPAHGTGGVTDHFRSSGPWFWNQEHRARASGRWRWRQWRWQILWQQHKDPSVTRIFARDIPSECSSHLHDAGSGRQVSVFLPYRRATMSQRRRG